MAIAVATRNTGVVTSASTSWAITLPSSGAVTGDVYIVVANPGGASTLSTSSSGWTKLVQGGASGVPIAVFVGVVGTAGALTIASSASVEAAYAGLRLTGASNTGISSAFTNGSSTTPAAPALTPAGGSRQYLWLVAVATDLGGGGDQPTTAPTGWGNFQAGDTGSPGFSSEAAIATAELIATAASESPGNWGSVTFSNAWSTLTLAIAAGASTVDASTAAIATTAAVAVRTANGAASTTATSGVSAAAARTANVAAPLSATAGLTAAVARTTYADAATSTMGAVTAAAVANYAATADRSVTAGVTGVIGWAAHADTTIAVTAGLTCNAVIGPIARADSIVTASATAVAQRATHADAPAATTATTTAIAARITLADAVVMVTAGLTAHASTPADPIATQVTAALTASAVTVRPIAADLVITVTRSGRFSQLTSGHLLVTVTTTASAVVTPAGVKTVNGAQAVTVTTSAAIQRNAAVDSARPVTVGLAAVMAGSLHGATSRRVVVYLTASAWIVGQPVPHTPPERTISIPAEDRTRVICAEDRTQVTHVEVRNLEIVLA